MLLLFFVNPRPHLVDNRLEADLSHLLFCRRLDTLVRGTEHVRHAPAQGVEVVNLLIHV